MSRVRGGGKVEAEVTPGSALGLGRVMLGEVEVAAGLGPAASCCLVDGESLEQHLGQAGFRQAKGWDTYLDKSDDVKNIQSIKHVILHWKNCWKN